MISPFNLVQEQQLDKPYSDWRILVVCALLNRTHGRQVRPIVDRLFEIAPTPADMMRECSGPSEAVRDVLRPLGLYNRRASLLVGLSRAYIDRRATRGEEVSGEWARSMPGCGQYAVDSLNVVLYGILENPSSDTWLQRYVNWRRDHPQ